MSNLALFFLGPPRVERDGAPIEINRRKAVALLAYLAVTGERHSRETLATLLWPEFDQTRARAALRRTLSALKNALAGDGLAVDREAIKLELRSEDFLDVDQFHSLLALCRLHGHPETEVCPQCLPPLAEAAALYGEDFLTGFTLRDSAAFDEWQFFQTESLRRELAGALERLVQGHTAQNQFESAIDHARRWLALDLFHEPAHHHLMLLYAWSGQRSAALRQYRECARVLERELSLSPQERTTQLYKAIKANRAPPPPTAPPEALMQIEAAPIIRIPERRWAQPLVGRQEELRLLRSRLDAALMGEGSLVFLIGEAGIGKTRSAYELSDYAKAKNAQFILGRGHKRDQTTPYRPWLDIFRAYVRWAPPPLLARLAGNVGPGLARLVPELGERPAATPASEAAPVIQQPPERTLLFDAVTQLLVNVSREAPLVLFLDDLQWADETSLQLLRHVAQHTTSERILLLGAYRELELENRRALSRVMTEMNRERLFYPLHLNRLGPREVSQMIGQTFGQEMPPELGELVFNKTEGNPFFVEELLRLLHREGMISPTEEGWKTRDLSVLHVPRGIKAVVEERLERCDEELRQVLSVAAVIGREFSFAVLQAITGIEEDTLVDLVDEALLAQLLVDRNIPGEEVYAFADTPVRDVLYAGISAIRRRRFHLSVGEVLERVYAAQIDERVEELAHHFLEGNDAAKAADYAQKAGDKALSVFAWGEARAQYETALELLEEDNLAQRAAVLDKLSATTGWLGDYDASVSFGKASLELYEELGDKANIIRVHMALQMLYTAGAWDGAREFEALEHLQQVAAMIEGDPDSVEKGRVYERAAHIHLHYGEPARALEWLRKVVDVFDTLGLSRITQLGTALTYTGRIGEGLAYSEGLWESVLELGNPLQTGVFGHQLTLTLALVRDVPRARQWGERILPEVARAGFLFEAFLRRPLALIYALSGQVGEAEHTCQVEEEIESKTLVGCYFEDTCGIGMCYFRRGQWEKAKAYLQQATAIHQDRKNLAAVSACSFVRGSISLAEGSYAEATELLLRSLEICRSGANILFELWVLPVLTELYLKAGRPNKAAECVERGFELLKPGQSWYGLPGPMYLARGLLASAHKSWDEAAECFAEAVAVDRQYELPWDEAKTLYEWGLMHLNRGSAGDREQALGKLDRALALFQRIDAKKDVERVLAQKAALKA